MSFPVYATSPLPYAIAGVLVLAGCWRCLPGWVRIAGCFVELLLLVTMMPVGANALAGWVAGRAPPPSSCKVPVPTTVVVLGGGGRLREAHAVDDFGVLSQRSLERLFAAIALWRRTPGARLVIAGGSVDGLPEALMLQSLAERLGVPATALEVETRSQNTWQNARNVALLSPPMPRRIWLVTSAMHLPRALGAFRAWGFDPCPWPAGSARPTRGFQLQDLVPQGRAVSKAAIAIHEWIGGMWYAVLEQRHARQVKHAAQDSAPRTPGE